MERRGEPNDAGGRRCRRTLGNGLWNDLPNANTPAYSRDYVVEYETQLDEKPPAPLIYDGPTGGAGTFGVRTIRVGAMPGGLYEAEANLIAGAGTGE